MRLLRANADKVLAANLKRAIGERKALTLQMLSDRTGIDLTTLSKYQNGDRRITGKALIKLSNALAVPVEQLRLGTWDKPLAVFRYPKNPRPFRLDPIFLDGVCLLYGNHTQPLELFLAHDNEQLSLHSDFQFVYEDLAAAARKKAADEGHIYFNGPNTRLRRAVPKTYIKPSGEEAHAVLLEMGPVSWENYTVLNASMDVDIWKGDLSNTIRKRFANHQLVFENQFDVSWCPLSNILTVFMMPITNDGYCVVQRRSKKGVSAGADKLTSGVTENINRVMDEADVRKPGVRVNSRLQPPRSQPRDHTYKVPAGHSPSPILTALRGVEEELSEELHRSIHDHLEVVKFLNLSFELGYFHPVLIGVLDLPFRRTELESIIERSPGKDHTEGVSLHYIALDMAEKETLSLVRDSGHWLNAGLASFVSAVNYWQSRTSAR